MKKPLLGLLMVLCAGPLYAWPGWKWEDWQAQAGVAKPEVSSPQAGQAALYPLLKDAQGQAISAPEAWQAKRGQILEVLQAFIGTPRDSMPPQKPAALETGREDLGGYERIHLRIPCERTDTSFAQPATIAEIPAYLLLPKTRSEAKAPVMIVLHQTVAQGKEEPCGMKGDPNMAFAKELVERGIICIAPDAIGFGERIRPGGQPYDNSMEFYALQPQWSFFGKMNWDVSRVVDYLETLEYVDPGRIGIIGHSHGAYGSIMGAVFESRISLVVASCGFTTLRKDPIPDRWSHLTALLPRLGFYTADIKSAPFDWHEIISCIAPRPYFNWATLEDKIFPETDNLSDVYDQVRGVYALDGKEAEFVGKLAPGEHRFPPEAREEAYAFIEQNFAKQ